MGLELQRSEMPLIFYVAPPELFEIFLGFLLTKCSSGAKFKNPFLSTLILP